MAKLRFALEELDVVMIQNQNIVTQMRVATTPNIYIRLCVHIEKCFIFYVKKILYNKPINTKMFLGSCGTLNCVELFFLVNL